MSLFSINIIILIITDFFLLHKIVNFDVIIEFSTDFWLVTARKDAQRKWRTQFYRATNCHLTQNVAAAAIDNRLPPFLLYIGFSELDVTNHTDEKLK